MRSLFLIILAVALMSFSIISFTSNSYATTATGNEFAHNWNGGGNSSLNQQNSSGTYLSPPSINFNPLPNPSLPSFPGYWVNFSIPLIGTFNLSLPNFADLPGFFTAYATYVFEWIGVQIGNGILYVIQALYLVFAYIEYWLLLAFVDISNALGIFALPVIVSLLIVIAIVIRLVIGLAKDATIVLGAG